MRIRQGLGYRLLLVLVLATASIAVVGFFAERQSLKHFCARIPPNMSGDALGSMAEAKGYDLVDPPDGAAFVRRDSAYLPFHFESCHLAFDSLLRHQAPVKSAEFEESNMPPMFWNYDLPTSIPFFTFVICCNFLLGFYGNGRGSRVVGSIGASVSIAFLLMAIDHNNGYRSPVTGFGLSFDLIEYLGYAMLATTLLTIALLLANPILADRKPQRT